MKKKDRGDLLHHSIIYKILSSLLYIIAYPILFVLTKLVHGLEIEGRENLKNLEDGYIVTANHINMLDCAMVVLSLFPRTPYFLTLQTNLEIPFIKYLVALFRAFPVPRKYGDKVKMVNTVDKLLKDEEIVGIYPEGELIPYYNGVREFKDGAFNFAVKNQVPVLPIVFTYREVTGWRKYFKRKPFITLNILEPEYPEEYFNKENVRKLKEKVHRKMQNPNVRKKATDGELESLHYVN